MTCYLVEYTLYSFHVRFIYPFSFQSLIGVVGIDIALSELLQNTVVSKQYFPSEFYALHFNYSFTRVSASFIKRLLQSFGPGELSYTFVIETENGRALVHPQLPEPEEIQEEPVVIIISDLETSPGKRWFLAMFSPYECYENPTQGGRRKEREIGAGRTRDDFHRFWYRQIWRTSTVFLFSLSATLNYSHPWVMLAIDVWALSILQTDVTGTARDWHWNLAMLRHVLSPAWYVILRLWLSYLLLVL